MHVMMISTADKRISEDAASALVNGWAEELDLFAEQIAAGKA